MPVKRFMLAHALAAGRPLLLAFAGWRLGGRAAGRARACGLALFIAFTGQWEKAMVTRLSRGISVLVAALIGIPLGIAGRPVDARSGACVEAVIDTLQTLPSFVYLIPVVMLFRVGDFTAMIAIVALRARARDPLHRARHPRVSARADRGRHGGRLHAAAAPDQDPAAAGAPEILLGINQTIMLALSMLVITALVGTRDLGQEVYIALTKADTGRGLVAGLCVAAIAIIADRLIQTAARAPRRPTGRAHA